MTDTGSDSIITDVNANVREVEVIKAQFFEEVCKLQKPDKTETRAISRSQLESLIELIRKKDTTNPKYYYWITKYYVTNTEPPQLAAVEENDNGVPKVVVCLEDMFEVCYKIHEAVGHSGRNSMEVEGAKFYANITRSVIGIFLKYSKEYQP